MRVTTNYKLKLPSYDDVIDIEVLNKNMEDIDNLIKSLQLKLNYISNIVDGGNREVTVQTYLSEFEILTLDERVSTVHDNAIVTMNASVDTEILVGTSESKTLSNLNQSISLNMGAVSGFNEGTGKECPIYISYNLDTKAIGIEGNVAYTEKAFCNSRTIYAKIGTMNFDYISSKVLGPYSFVTDTTNTIVEVS